MLVEENNHIVDAVIDITPTSNSSTGNEEKYNAALESLLLVYNADERQNRYLTIAEAYKKKPEIVEDDFFEVLKQEIVRRIEKYKDLKDTTKIILYKNAVDTYLKNFVPTPKDRTSIIKNLSKAYDDPKLYTLKDLLDMGGSSNDQWLVPSLFKLSNFIVLSSLPKTGKSMIANSLAISVMLGKPFLNRTGVQQGNVFYLQNEEYLGDTGKRLWGNGLQNYQLQDYAIYNELIESQRLTIGRDYDIGTDLDEIFDIVEKRNIKLLIIDSLSKSILKSGASEYDGVAMMRILGKLHNRVQDAGIFCLLIHHDRKSADNSNQGSAIEGMSGTAVIPRINDGMIKAHLKLVEEGEGKRKNMVAAYDDDGNRLVQLDFYFRNSAPVSIEVALITGEHLEWDWKVHKDDTIDDDKLDILSSIINLLKKQRESWLHSGNTSQPIFGYSIKDISSLLELPKKVVVENCNYLLQTDAVTIRPVKRKYIYYLPEDHTWLDSTLESYKEKQAQKKQEELERQSEIARVSKFINDIKAAESVDEFNQLTRVVFGDMDNKAIYTKISDLVSQDTASIFIKHFALLTNPNAFKINSKVIFDSEEYIVIDVLLNPTTKTYDLYTLKHIESNDILEGIDEQSIMGIEDNEEN